MRMSLCMIVRQEEKALARCLEGIADAVEEIVIVDMGSTDRTKVSLQTGHFHTGGVDIQSSHTSSLPAVQIFFQIFVTNTLQFTSRRIRSKSHPVSSVCSMVLSVWKP